MPALAGRLPPPLLGAPPDGGEVLVREPAGCLWAENSLCGIASSHFCNVFLQSYFMDAPNMKPDHICRNRAPRFSRKDAVAAPLWRSCFKVLATAGVATGVEVSRAEVPTAPDGG